MAQSGNAVSPEANPAGNAGSIPPSAAAVDPNAPVSTSAPTGPTDSVPFNWGPQDGFHFLSPALVYDPPDAWVTSMLRASTNTSATASVSLSTLASGVTWRFDQTDVSVLVNGSDPAEFNATTTVSDTNATVSGLEYGWYNFTLVTNGTGSVSGVAPIVDGSEWLPAQKGPMTAVNATGNPLYSTAGTWTGESNLATNSTGSSLTIHPPAGTVLLEITQDMPSVPAADFDVSVSPAPPRQPANQSFTGSIRPADMLAAIGILNVVLYRVELDPQVSYTVNVEYTGDGTRSLHVSNIGAYQAQQSKC